MKKIDRFLNEFARANKERYTSNEYSFTLISENKNEDVVTAIRTHYQLDADDKVTVIPFNHWEEQLFEDDEYYWLNGDYWLEKTPINYESKEPTPKQELVKLLLEEMSQPEKVYYADMNGVSGYFACSWLEVVFVAEKGLYLLSFQVHD